MNLNYIFVYCLIAFEMTIYAHSIKKEYYLNNVTQFMKYDMQVQRLTLINFGKFKYYSPEYMKVVREITKEFPTTTVQLNKPSDNTKLVEKMIKPLTTPRTNEMTIMMMDIQRNHREFEKELGRQLAFFKQLSHTYAPYPHCLLLVVSNKPIFKLSSKMSQL